jgi:hypothetical protein
MNRTRCRGWSASAWRIRGVVIGEFVRGCWQAWIPEPAGGTLVTRYSLRELLDKLAELLGGADDH